MLLSYGRENVKIKVAVPYWIHIVCSVCVSVCILPAHSAMTGTSACVGLGTLAFFSKVGKIEGWKLAGPPKLWEGRWQDDEIYCKRNSCIKLCVENENLRVNLSIHVFQWYYLWHDCVPCVSHQCFFCCRSFKGICLSFVDLNVIPVVFNTLYSSFSVYSFTLFIAAVTSVLYYVLYCLMVLLFFAEIVLV